MMRWPMVTIDKAPAAVSDATERRALEILADTPELLTPLELQKVLCRVTGISSAPARAAVRRLVLAGRLGYRSIHGRTVIGPNYLQPVRVAPHVLLCPPGMTPATDPGDVAVFLAAGVSFGNGEHPSTRLAIRQLDHLLRERDLNYRGVLDIGTGSGVLALTALRLGVARAVGLDSDPCALPEARANARLNGLQRRMAISDRTLERLSGTYPLIVANLRPPTLCRLGSQVCRLASPGAFLVLAGLRGAEAAQVLAAYADQGFVPAGQEEEQGWCALLLRKAGA